MIGKMKVSIMTGIRELDFVERDIPSPSASQVLVKLHYVGICGSDIHYYENGRIGDYIVKPPFVLGHEAAGEVVEIGAAVVNLRIGDRVALEPGIPCGYCEFCREGKYNLCPDVAFFATPPIDGVFQEYVAHEESFCFKLPNNVSTLEGALIEPLAVGFHAANQCDSHVGQTAIVFGAGCIGLVTMMALKARGVSRIFLVDILPKRLDKAIELGATATINSSMQDVVKAIKNMTDSRGCDIAIDTAGTEMTITQAIQVVKKGANVVLVGYSKTGTVNFPLNLALDKEIDLKTIFRYRHIFPMAIDAVASEKINLKGIVTNIFTFNDIRNAMDKSIDQKSSLVKAVIKISG